MRIAERINTQSEIEENGFAFFRFTFFKQTFRQKESNYKQNALSLLNNFLF